MRHIIQSSLLLFISFAGVHADDEADIRQASKLWVETYNSNDWQALSLLFTPDAEMMPPNSPAVVGRDAIAKWEAANESGFQIAFDVQEIKVLGDVAYVKGRSCVFIPLDDGSRGVDIGKFLETRERQPNGQWLIARDIFNSDLAVGAGLSSTCPF